MSEKSSIIIGIPKLKGNKITNEITMPERLKKFVKEDFYATYDEDIDCDESIQVIPALASMLPLAWLSGSDIHVNKLDQAFFGAMDNLQIKYRELYPKAPFKTKIIFNELVENAVGTEGTALNFSGGVDSTYALASIFDLKPRLIMIYRFTHHDRSFFNRISGMYRDLAENAGLAFNVVESNIRDILGFGIMNINFQKYLGTTVWASLQQVLNQLGVVAPLSMGRFNRLSLASTYSQKQYDRGGIRHSSRPSIDETIAWADLSVKHEGYIDRIDKAPSIIDFMDETGFKLHVCLGTSYSTQVTFDLNCGHCPKCVGTSILLLILGRDPRAYGLPISENSWNLFKDSIKKRDDSSYRELDYRRMHGMIPKNIEEDFYGSKKFLKWFRGYR